MFELHTYRTSLSRASSFLLSITEAPVSRWIQPLTRVQPGYKWHSLRQTNGLRQIDQDSWSRGARSDGSSELSRGKLAPKASSYARTDSDRFVWLEQEFTAQQQREESPPIRLTELQSPQI